MVYSSAYRRAYRKPLWDDYGKEEFISKLQYRSDRRSIEHRHQPWRWDSESEEEDIEEIPAHDGSYDGDAVSFIQTRKRLIKNRQRTHGKKRKISKRTIMLKEPYFCPKDLSLTKQRKKKNQNIRVLRETKRT